MLKTTACCLHSNTQILMADGSIKLLHMIQIGDRVCNEHSRIMVVENVWRGREPQYLLIETESGNSLSVTDDHPILTAQGWKRANALSVGDTLQKLDKSTTKIKSIATITESIDVYNLSADNYNRSSNSLIANGLIVGTFEMQCSLL